MYGLASRAEGTRGAASRAAPGKWGGWAGLGSLAWLAWARRNLGLGLGWPKSARPTSVADKGTVGLCKCSAILALHRRLMSCQYGLRLAELLGEGGRVRVSGVVHRKVTSCDLNLSLTQHNRDQV